MNTVFPAPLVIFCLSVAGGVRALNKVTQCVFPSERGLCRSLLSSAPCLPAAASSLVCMQGFLWRGVEGTPIPVRTTAVGHSPSTFLFSDSSCLGTLVFSSYTRLSTFLIFLPSLLPRQQLRGILLCPLDLAGRLSLRLWRSVFTTVPIVPHCSGYRFVQSVPSSRLQPCSLASLSLACQTHGGCVQQAAAPPCQLPLTPAGLEHGRVAVCQLTAPGCFTMMIL